MIVFKFLYRSFRVRIGYKWKVMKRIYILIVVLVNFCTISFSQETGWQIVDTVRVSERVYKVSVKKDLYSYENIRDSLRYLPDDVEWRYLGDSYPVRPFNFNEMVEMIVKELRYRITKQVCNEVGYFTLGFYLYADMEGNIKEVVPGIPAKLYPYFSVVDFDRVVMRLLNCRIYVDHKNPAFAKGRWVRCIFTIVESQWLETLQKYESEP